MSGRNLSRIIERGNPDAIRRAAETLASGGLVAFPTDTVYGLAASIDRADAVARLYTAKGRPLDRPIPVLVSSREQVGRLASTVDRRAEPLMEHFWPGALTIVLPAAGWLPGEVVRDTGQVGVRMPDHPQALAIIAAAGGALATTSANRSGEPEAATAAEVRTTLGEAVDLIIDGGPAGRVPSTVVSVVGDRLHLLRQGAIGLDQIRRIVPDLRLVE
jgi:L-threonylcarbamoyladenylate synthase